ADFAASDIVTRGLDGTVFTLTIGGAETKTVNLSAPGRFNVLNALAALAASQAVGVDPSIAVAALSRAQAPFGRFETIDVNGTDVVLLLAKNTVGLDEVINFLADLAPEAGPL